MRTFKAFNLRRDGAEAQFIVYGSTPRAAARGVLVKAKEARQRVLALQIQEGDLEGEEFLFLIGPAGVGNRHWRINPEQVETLPDCAEESRALAVAM